MHQVQNRLDFEIEIPSDTELSRRFGKDERDAKAFAAHQKTVNMKQASTRKHKKRLQKSAKKLARLTR